MRTHRTIRAAAVALAVAGGLMVGLGVTSGTPARAAAGCPMISARLGLHWPYSSLPENSAAAIDAAHKAGAPKVEIDVNFSRDGIPMAIHDARVDDVTAHTGRVTAYPAARLETFPLRVEGVSRNKRMSSQHLQSLFGALYRAKVNGMRVSVEIKPHSITNAQARAVALRLRWLNDWSMIDVRAFDLPVLVAMRKADSRIRTTLITRRPVVPAPRGIVMESIEYKQHGVAISPATVHALQASGVRVDAFTPDTSSEFVAVPRTVDQITTNNVAGARAFLKAHGC